jgi:hypothetical protein
MLTVLSKDRVGLCDVGVLLLFISHENASTIAEYILAMKTEINLSDHYRQDNIITLCKLSKSKLEKYIMSIKSRLDNPSK